MSESSENSGLKGALEKVRGFLGALSRPTKIIAATTMVVMVLALSWLGFRAANEPYTVLFSQLTSDDAGGIVAKLKEMKVPYRVVDGGRIEVPEARVHELRMDMATLGLPRGGGVGFEAFDKPRLGATEFEQRVMFRRAMEGELSRTIGAVSVIESARVHLVLPEKSVFVQKREPASASVVVKLRGGRELGAGEISAIIHLVASAVPGLSADQVTLATTEGALLKKPRSVDGDEGASVGGMEEPLAEVRSYEARLEERAKNMLARVVGDGHIDVRVSAEMDFSKLEQTVDRFTPSKTALRSEQLSFERAGGATDDTVAGVPGAESNVPTGSADSEEAEVIADKGVVRHEHTRNFEIDRVTEKRTSRTGTLKRLTVAVVVDGVPMTDDAGNPTVVPRDQEELDQLATLVRSAVGADDRREDLVTVQSIPFIDHVATGAPGNVGDIADPVSVPAFPRRTVLIAAGATAGFLLLVSMALVVRRKRRIKTEKQQALLIAAATPPAGLLPAEELKPEDLRVEALRCAQEDPASAALVIRHWLGHAEAARAA